MAHHRDVSRLIGRTTAPRSVKFLGVGERQIRVIASDATPDRMGDVLEPNGVRLDNYRRNPIVLAQHNVDQPIARCATIGVEDNNKVAALIDFPPEGVSDLSDEYLRLMKAGIIKAVSVGFLPISWEPIRGAGLRFTAWEMLELSCVSVPANPAALVTERGFGGPSLVADHLARAAQIRASLERRGEIPVVRDIAADPAELHAQEVRLHRRDRAAAADMVARMVQW